MLHISLAHCFVNVNILLRPIFFLLSICYTLLVFWIFLIYLNLVLILVHICHVFSILVEFFFSVRLSFFSCVNGLLRYFVSYFHHAESRISMYLYMTCFLYSIDVFIRSKFIFLETLNRLVLSKSFRFFVSMSNVFLFVRSWQYISPILRYLIGLNLILMFV